MLQGNKDNVITNLCEKSSVRHTTSWSKCIIWTTFINLEWIQSLPTLTIKHVPFIILKKIYRKGIAQSNKINFQSNISVKCWISDIFIAPDVNAFTSMKAKKNDKIEIFFSYLKIWVRGFECLRKPSSMRHWSLSHMSWPNSICELWQWW